MKGIIWTKTVGPGQAMASVVKINTFFNVIATGKSSATKPGCYRSKAKAIAAASSWVANNIQA